ncbi:MAG TPA: phosphatase PAP2 family protein [Candidatus Sulfotelmatobacter sp.]|nr:phosphatase PAP2 family protein [Candidatus Sulfotelmatobacter sp.]
MPLIPRLLAIGVMCVVYVGLTISITARAFTGLDTQVAQAMHSAWQPSLHVVFQLIAELGGLEVTTIVMAGLTFYLWRAGFGSDALVFVVFLAAQALELYYKLNFYHPGPPRSLGEADGPSITTFLESGQGLGNSFPSGHMLRAVIVYGLLAFVIRRLSPSPAVRTLAVVGATVVIVLLAFDRLYLDVHWESDVVGGLVLGAIGLLAGTVWLDRPRKPQN